MYIRTRTAFVDGRSARLLRLDGTISVQMKSSGNTYNYPLQMWLLQDYPELPPLCYVRPTSTMKVNPKHKHLDSNGQVYLPFLHLWSQGSHNLAGLGHELANAFSEEAPVHAVSQRPAVAQPAGAWGVGVGVGGNGNGNAAANGASTARPYANNPYMPTRTQHASTQQRSPYGSSSTHHHQQQQQSPYSTTPTQPPTSSSSSSSSSPFGGTKPVQRESSEETAVMQQVLKDSLIGEKDNMLCSNLNELKRATEDRLAAPNDTKAGLQYSQQRISEVEGRVQTGLREVSNALHFYDSQLPALEASVAKLEETKSKPMDIDAVLVATQPLYNQIMCLRAENVAYEEMAREVLKQVTQDKTDWAKTVKQIRMNCYKEQFMVAELLKKAEKAAAS